MDGGANARGVDVAACEVRKGTRSLVAAGESVERLPSCGPGDGAAEALARSGQDVFWDGFPRFATFLTNLDSPRIVIDPISAAGGRRPESQSVPNRG